MPTLAYIGVDGNGKAKDPEVIDVHSFATLLDNESPMKYVWIKKATEKALGGTNSSSVKVTTGVGKKRKTFAWNINMGDESCDVFHSSVGNKKERGETATIFYCLHGSYLYVVGAGQHDTGNSYFVRWGMLKGAEAACD